MALGPSKNREIFEARLAEIRARLAAGEKPGWIPDWLNTHEQRGRGVVKKQKRPWDSESAIARKAIIPRLPLRTLVQLRYIAAREERTQQKCLDRILLPAIERQAEELWEEEESGGET